jgi:hypothetical protein
MSTTANLRQWVTYFVSLVFGGVTHRSDSSALYFGGKFLAMELNSGLFTQHSFQ